jgi:hypothetical protein
MNDGLLRYLLQSELPALCSGDEIMGFSLLIPFLSPR